MVHSRDINILIVWGLYDRILKIINLEIKYIGINKKVLKQVMIVVQHSAVRKSLHWHACYNYC